ncbi:hypothetical protein P153DRAFT_390086 [Dothidotthia symphoricarpi CBS 119687]|uniref:Uncharacterized protein n=1 Tax=Dothidotthia symphoricarpi CBS 119687 TaxID=1392245 RepID=A0A6A6A229_9PLEO|nr:uncharacterized protein P153DRAFT_390086 [Dothidotthia symphoricarpi CBS 119687]KAF2125234.1 hypothetical protein P153DRAFT_390086 [Dothidotthia symphoricarpi CBS 119687]
MLRNRCNVSLDSIDSPDNGGPPCPLCYSNPNYPSLGLIVVPTRLDLLVELERACPALQYSHVQVPAGRNAALYQCDGSTRHKQHLVYALKDAVTVLAHG